MLSIKNKIRKALGMKPVSENRLDKSGEGTVTDYFPDFSVKQVREYRRGGELIYSSDYGKDEICKNFYTAGKLKSVTTISKETGARTSKTTYYHDGRRTVGSFENDKQIGSTDYFPDGHQIVTTFSKERGAKTGRTTSYPDGRQTVDIFEKGKQVGATDYFPDDSKIVSEFLDDDDHSYGEENYHGLCYRTKINADGSIAYKDRLYDYGIGPVTSVFSEESRKTAYIAAYVNGYRLGDAIGLGHAHDPAQTAESVRQNTLYNAACNAIWHGDQKKLEAITEQALKQKELLDNPEFQSLLNSCYMATKDAVKTEDVHTFQKEFHKRLEDSGYQKLMPAAKASSSLRKMREAVGEKNETTVKTESNEKSSPTVEKPNRQMMPPQVERDTY